MTRIMVRGVWRMLEEFQTSECLVRAMVKFAPSECRCARCVQMCRNAPCLGTPQDIERLMDAGHYVRLRPTRWTAGRGNGVPEIRMIQVERTKGGACAMLANGRCTLHAAGLKPTEGVLACHEAVRLDESPTYAVALTWIQECNLPLVASLFVRLALETLGAERRVG